MKESQTLNRIDIINYFEKQYPYYNGRAANLNTVTDEIIQEIEKGTNMKSIVILYSFIGKELSWEVV